MPRDQETSIGHDPTTSDDPLFRRPSDQPSDQPGDDSLRGHGDPLRDPAGTGAGADRDETAAAGDTPIGDELAAGRHAAASGDTASGESADTPGEWVAGPKGPDYATDRDTVVPEQAGQPSVETTDTSSGGAAGRGAASMDPDAPDATAEAPDTLRATADTDAPTSTGATSATRAAAPDLRATSDPEVAPDAVAPGSEVTPDTGFPVQSAAGTPAAQDTTPAATDTSAATATDTSAESTAATDAPGQAGPPAAPVPGAPGTGRTTGVEAAAATLVTNGDQLHDDWGRIQSAFVDDPQGSVSQAADLVAQVTNTLVTALQERERTLRGAWDGKSSSDTENLRNALRDYRAYFELLIKL